MARFRDTVSAAHFIVVTEDRQKLFKEKGFVLAYSPQAMKQNINEYKLDN